jgi:hypothetical protein
MSDSSCRALLRIESQLSGPFAREAGEGLGEMEGIAEGARLAARGAGEKGLDVLLPGGVVVLGVKERCMGRYKLG